jgi:hypothetical protein
MLDSGQEAVAGLADVSPEGIERAGDDPWTGQDFRRVRL